MKTGRRGFLGSFAGILTFAAFEKKVMAEVGVSSPIQLQTSTKSYVVKKKVINDERDYLAVAADYETAYRTSIIWNYDLIGNANIRRIAKTINASVDQAKLFLKKIGVQTYIYSEDVFVDSKRPSFEAMRLWAEKFQEITITEIDKQSFANTKAVFLTASNYDKLRCCGILVPYYENDEDAFKS